MRLTTAQKKVLENLDAGRWAFSHLRGQSQFGGSSGTLFFLIKNKLCYWHGGTTLRMTKRGKEVYQENL